MSALISLFNQEYKETLKSSDLRRLIILKTFVHKICKLFRIKKSKKKVLKVLMSQENYSIPKSFKWLEIKKKNWKMFKLKKAVYP